jgi:hypothetical protein
VKEEWADLHQHIVCLLHSLVFDGYGLKGDAQEKLIRRWYEDYKPLTVQEAEKHLKP